MLNEIFTAVAAASSLAVVLSGMWVLVHARFVVGPFIANHSDESVWTAGRGDVERKLVRLRDNGVDDVFIARTLYAYSVVKKVVLYGFGVLAVDLVVAAIVLVL